MTGQITNELPRNTLYETLLSHGERQGSYPSFNISRLGDYPIVQTYDNGTVNIQKKAFVTG